MPLVDEWVNNHSAHLGHGCGILCCTKNETSSREKNITFLNEHYEVKEDNHKRLCSARFQFLERAKPWKQLKGKW